MLLPLLAALSAIPRFAQSDGEMRLREFVDALNSQNQAKVEAFVRERCHPTNGPVSERASRLFQLAKVGTPLDVVKLLKDEPTVAIAELKSSGGDPWELRLNMESDPPHWVKSIYMGGPGSQTSPPAKQFKDWKDLTDLITQIKADTKVPAIGIAYWQGDRPQLAVAGERELGKPDKVTLQDRWLIGSITKSMTSMMIARLVDKGLMRWDMTIAEALPNTPMREEYRSVTLLQLLRHRAGVPQDRYATPEFLKQAAGDSKDIVPVREHYTRFTLARDPIAKPDERMAYSNAGYSIAAHMAETVAKKPYEALMRDLVFKPLNMASVRMGVPGAPGNPGSPGQIMGHIIGDDGLEPHVIGEHEFNAIQEPAGMGVSMCLLDLLKFAQYHLDGLRGHVRLMSKQNFDILHQPAETGPGVYKYGCGWVIDESTAKEPFQGHTGSDGTFYAELAIWPNQNLAAVAIINCNTKQSPSPPMQAILAVYDRLAQGEKR